MQRSLHKCSLAPSRGPPNPFDDTIGWVQVTGHRASGVDPSIMNDTSTESKTGLDHSDTHHYIPGDNNKHFTTRPITYTHPITPCTRSLGSLPPRTSTWYANAQEAAARGADIARLESHTSGASGTSEGALPQLMPAASYPASAATERNMSRSATTARPRSIAVGGGAPSGAVGGSASHSRT
jgi:hypothetical protein